MAEQQQMYQAIANLIALDIPYLDPPLGSTTSTPMSKGFVDTNSHGTTKSSKKNRKHYNFSSQKDQAQNDIEIRKLSSQLNKDYELILCKLRKIQQSLVTENVTYIYPCDFLRHSYVINKPGVYRLADDITLEFEVRQTIPSAIIINASNVVLDLNDKTLAEFGSTLAVGVLVNSQSNIIIKNGTIRNFKLNGIRLNSGSDLVILDKVRLQNNGSASVSATAGLPGGLTMSNSTNILLVDSQLDENIGVGGGIGGSSNILTKNCSFDGNLPTTAVSAFTGVTFGLAILVEDIPIFQNGAEDIFVLDSTFINNSGSGSAFGLAILGSVNLGGPVGPQIYNVLVESCEISNTSTSGGGTTGLVTEGLTTLIHNGVIRNCKVFNTTSTNTLNNHLVGLEASGSSIVIDNCVVNGVSGTSTRMAGFDVESQGNDIIFKNSECFNISNENTATGSFVYGFGLAIPILLDGLIIEFQSSNIIGDGCTSSNVHLAGGPSLPVPPMSGVIPIPNRALGLDSPRKLNLVQLPSLSAGFLINATTSPILTNCISSNNDVGILVYDYLVPGTSPPFGGVTTNGFIKSNQIINNIYAGIVDETTANNAYIDNYARTNGPVSNANYVGLPAGTPISTWILPGAPSGDVTKLTNMDIRP